jgi:penicillin-binding protein 1C
MQIEAPHFVDYVRQNSENNFYVDQSKIVTTLDGNLQIFTKDLLENRLKALASKNIKNAAALVVNHQTHEILAWVSVGIDCEKTANEAKGCKIDMVTVPRQPGSTLKPFLYAAALEKGWSAATIIDDSPYSEMVGKGIHHFHNYSNSYYGKVSLRKALGNSLNIPALHAAAYVTPEKYLPILQNIGFKSLTQKADFYGDGLALGNGEVTLFEMAQAYATLANNGKFEPLKITFSSKQKEQEKQIYSVETASLIGNILSDPWARSLEFGHATVLNFPTQTAVKTGTSTDYRDAWAVGYNHKYAAVIWMGNVDYEPTDGITGSLGPSLALRGIFNELTKNSETKPLFLSPQLIAKDICINPEESLNCATYTEYFLPQFAEKIVEEVKSPNKKIEIFRPTDHLEMAIDPRIPSNKQAFEMSVSGILESDKVEWKIDQEPSQFAEGSKFLWMVKKGKHQVKAVVWRDGKILMETESRVFNVK